MKLELRAVDGELLKKQNKISGRIKRSAQRVTSPDGSSLDNAVNRWDVRHSQKCIEEHLRSMKMLPYEMSRRLAKSGVKDQVQGGKKIFEEGKVIEGTAQGVVGGVKRVVSYANPFGSAHGHIEALKEIED